jgi:hypothetical protein
MEADYAAPLILDTQDTWNVSASYNRNLAAWPTVFATDQDLTYLEAALQMRLRMSGCTISPADAEYILYVLVDVLGINRSRADGVVYIEEDLVASCEITYYILDLRANQVLGAVQQTAARASYEEGAWLGSLTSKVVRSVCQVEPSPLPVDGNQLVVSASDQTQVPDGAEAAKDAQNGAALKAELQRKLEDANSYISAANVSAAEKVINEIRAHDPSFPGLDAASSRLEELKAQMADPNRQ